MISEEKNCDKQLSEIKYVHCMEQDNGAVLDEKYRLSCPGKQTKCQLEENSVSKCVQRTLDLWAINRVNTKTLFSGYV